MKEFTIKVKMQERWIPHFCSMLKYMQRLGSSMFIDATGLTEEELRKKLIEAGVCDHDIEIAWKHIREMEGDGGENHA